MTIQQGLLTAAKYNLQNQYMELVNRYGYEPNEALAELDIL